MEKESKAGFMALMQEDFRRRPLWMSLIFYFCALYDIYLHALRYVYQAGRRRS